MFRTFKRARSPELLRDALALKIAEAMDTAASEFLNAVLQKIRDTPGWLKLDESIADLQRSLKVLEGEISR